MRWLLFAPAFLLAAPPSSPPPQAFLAALSAALEAGAKAEGPIEVQRVVLPVDLEHHADSDGVFSYPLAEPVVEGLRARGVSACDPCTLEGPGPRWTRYTVYATDTPSETLWEIYVRAFERLPADGQLVRYSEGITRKYWVECPEGEACRVVRWERVAP